MSKELFAIFPQAPAVEGIERNRFGRVGFGHA